MNNAGQVFPDGDEQDPAGFEASIAVNLTGAFRLATACRELLAASELDGGASVVNLASMSSYFGLELVPGLRRREDRHPRGHQDARGRVGRARDPRQRGRARDHRHGHDGADDRIRGDEPSRCSPGSRSGAGARPTTSRHAVLFLASPGARYVTGQTLPIDGGFSIHG